MPCCVLGAVFVHAVLGSCVVGAGRWGHVVQVIDAQLMFAGAFEFVN